jgi:ribosomal protein S18 acetylase RimI-like enzyme
MAMIRQAEVGDARAVARVQVETWRAAYRGIMPDAILDSLDEEVKAARWWRYIESSPGSTRVAVDDGSVVGFADAAGCRDEGEPACVGEIRAIYVHPLHWRRGHGRDLLRAAIEHLGTDRSAVVLWVLEANAPARGFYEGHGFALDGGCRVRPPTGLVEVRYRASLLGGT